MNPFNIILVNPLINLLVAFYQGLLWLHVPFALGFAIILLTVIIRAAIAPLFASQQRMTKKMQELAPHLSKIKEKHKGDAKKQQEATMALYKLHNLNPAAGCIPGVLQLVVLVFGLYPALLKVLGVHTAQALQTINAVLYTPSLKLTHLWDPNFFGLNLAKTPADLIGTLGWVILLIPVATGVFQLVQSKMMMPAVEPKKEVKKGKQEDFATSFQKQSLYLIPFMVAFFSFRFSVGLSLYWNTFTLFGILQQYKMHGWGGVEQWIKFAKSKYTKNG